MATDVNVQFFSHLNGLVLSNTWGDMVRLLDTCLVNGLPFTSITSASIDANGDINLMFYAAHNAVLFQIVELTGFAPSEINGKYRIKGTPTTTQLILKAEHAGKTISTVGTAKLPPLGYDIIYRDAGDVKRVYRAKDPTSVHPFIRVDETISDGTNTYNSNYAKYAMVGLLENMTHIDDYEDSSRLQLPLDISDFKKNWKITGTGASVVRGWSKWYWAADYHNTQETNTPTIGNRRFTLVGDKDAFYLLNAQDADNNNVKRLNGCGLFNAALASDVIPNWFLMSTQNLNSAGSSAVNFTSNGYSPICYSSASAKFLLPSYNIVSRVSSSVYANPILTDYKTGYTGPFGSSNIPALEIPFYDDYSYLRGTLKHVAYAGKNIRTYQSTTTWLGDTSMYVSDSIFCNGNPDTGAIYFYLGELE